MRTRTFSNPPGSYASHPAADVKASWRNVVDDANTHGEVVVTSHDRPQVVVVSISRYAQLREQAAANDPLRLLRSEFDRQLAALEKPDTAARMSELLGASPEAMAGAANRAASRRKR